MLYYLGQLISCHDEELPGKCSIYIGPGGVTLAAGHRTTTGHFFSLLAPPARPRHAIPTRAYLVYALLSLMLLMTQARGDDGYYSPREMRHGLPAIKYAPARRGHRRRNGLYQPLAYARVDGNLLPPGPRRLMHFIFQSGAQMSNARGPASLISLPQRGCIDCADIYCYAGFLR